MAVDDLVLRFSYPSTGSSDLRTFTVHRISGSGGSPQELYKFQHPVTGLNAGVTTFYRKNFNTLVFETAGQIEWTSDINAFVHFGVDEVHIRELRKAKKSNSKSRRFKAGGSEYKWKLGGNDTDVYCVDTRGKLVATWSQEEMVLRVSKRTESVLDKIVVTCLLSLWFRKLGCW